MNQFDPRRYWETRLNEDFNLKGVGRTNFGIYYNRWAYRVRRKVFLRVVRSLDGGFNSMDVLDVGTGTGFYVDRWKELGVRSVTGIDLTDVAVSRLRHKYPTAKFYKIDIGNDLSELSERRFDAVSAMDVLFHIVDDSRYRRAIQNIHSLLKPGGLFIFSEQFLHRPTARSRHVVHRTLHTIQHYLQETGFEIVKRRPMFVLMDEPVDSTSRTLWAFWRLRQRALFAWRCFGLILGGILYPFELLLVSIIKESPTSEIAVCRRTL